MPKQAAITAVMISCYEREWEREKTLIQFERLGINVNVFTNPCNLEEPASPGKNMQNAIKALQFAAKTEQDVLFLEDDVDPSPELLDWLELLQDSGVFFADLCMMWRHVHPKAVTPFLEQSTMPPCIGVWREGERWWGTQGIYLSSKAVKIILAQDDHFKVPDWAFDIYLRYLMVRLAWPTWTCFPNPIQHRNPLSMVPKTNPDKGKVIPRPIRHSLTAHIKPSKPISQAIWLASHVMGAEPIRMNHGN